MPDSDLRVLVISDHPYTRAGIVSALSSQPHLEIAGQTDSGSALTDMMALYLPDAIIWEIPYEAVSAQLRLGEIRDLDIPVLVLLHDEQLAAELLAAGARGVLPRDADAETIAAALHALQANLIVVHSGLPAFVDTRTLMPPLPPVIDILTNRELEVLRLVAEGLPNKQIAIKLSVSEHTIKFHINAIMGKLGVQSRTEAVVRATRQGLIAL